MILALLDCFNKADITFSELLVAYCFYIDIMTWFVRMGSSMKKKISKIIAGVLAAVMTVSVMPVYATDDVFESIVEEESDNAVTEPAEGDGNTEDEVMPSYFEKELLQLSKISETDTSITISWSGINNADFSHYEILCNGIAANSGITYTQYTVT